MTGGEVVLAVAMALAPFALYMFAILRMAREAIATPAFSLAVTAGLICAPPVLAIDRIVIYAFPDFDPVMAAAFNAFVRAGLIEEGVRLAAIMWIVAPCYALRQPRDIVLLGGVVGLAFGTFENINAVLWAGRDYAMVALLRGVLTVPMHMMLGFWLGVGVARARAELRPAARIGFWPMALAHYAVAAVLHGMFDYPQFLAKIVPVVPEFVSSIVGDGGSFLDFYAALESTAFLAVLLCGVLALRFVQRAYVEHPERQIASLTALERLATGVVQSTAVGVAAVAAAAFVGMSAIALQLEAGIIGVSAQFWLRGVAAGAMGIVFAMMIATSLWSGRSGARAAGLVDPLVGVLFGDGGWRGRWPALATLAGLWLFMWAHGTAPVKAIIAGELAASARASLAAGRFVQASEEFTRALRWSASPEILLGRARAYRAQGRFDAGLADIEAADGEATDNGAIALERVALLMAKDDVAGVDVALEQVVRWRPDDIAALTVRAEWRVARGDMPGALSDLRQLSQRGAHGHRVRMAAGRFFWRRGMEKEAGVQFDAAVREAPRAPETWMRLGQFRLYSGDSVGAVRAFSRAAILGEAQAVVWMQLVGRVARTGAGDASALAGRPSWPGPLARMMAGRMPVEAALRLASGPAQACEARFFGGVRLASEGNVDAGRGLLLEAARECPVVRFERQAAQMTLAFVERLADNGKKTPHKDMR